MKKLISLMILSSGLWAQSTVTGLPQYMFGTGIAANPYATANSWLNKVSSVSTFAVRISNSNVYSWSSLQMIPGLTSGAMVSTGAAYVAYQQGRCSLLAIGEAGLTVNTNVTLERLAGWWGVTVPLIRAGICLVWVVLSITGISGNTVQPNFGIGILYSLGT